MKNGTINPNLTGNRLRWGAEAVKTGGSLVLFGEGIAGAVAGEALGEGGTFFDIKFETKFLAV